MCRVNPPWYSTTTCECVGNVCMDAVAHGSRDTATAAESCMHMWSRNWGHAIEHMDRTNARSAANKRREHQTKNAADKRHPTNENVHTGNAMSQQSLPQPRPDTSANRKSEPCVPTMQATTVNHTCVNRNPDTCAQTTPAGTTTTTTTTSKVIVKIRARMRPRTPNNNRLQH